MTRYSEGELMAAVEAIGENDRLREAESAVAAVAPQLQGILGEALAEAGWFEESREGAVLKAATAPDSDQRITAVRTLLAEETRLGMMVGVAVGWAIADELRGQPANEGSATRADKEE